MVDRPVVALIGMGLMGGVMAEHLLRAGRAVVGFDPVEERRVEHDRRGGDVARSVGEAVSGVEVSLLSLPDSSISRRVCDEIAAAGVEGMLVIDTTTGAPDDAVAAADALAGVGIGYVDATVSGNAAQARERDVIFMAGGTESGVERATELLSVLGRAVHRLGPVGAGATAKLVVNHILALNRAALAEGLTVAEKAGLDLDAVLEVVGSSAAASSAVDIWGRRMVDGDHRPPASRVRQNHKDLRLIVEHAAAVGASSEVIDRVREALVEAEQGGLADADNSAIIEVMRRRAGIGRLG